MKLTTEEEVRKRVDHIAEVGKSDDEMAHSDEDDLHQDVLRYYAEQENGALAREALKTLDISFARWCA